MRFGRALSVWMVCLVCASGLRAAELPNPKTRGAGGGPIAVLFLSWNPRLDATYAKKLGERGFVYANASYRQPLAPGFLTYAAYGGGHVAGRRRSSGSTARVGTSRRR